MKTTAPPSLSLPGMGISTQDAITNGAKNDYKPRSSQDGDGYLPVGTGIMSLLDANEVLNVLVGETADDEGNARCAVAIIGAKFVYSSALGWMRYTGTHYTRDEAEAYLDQALLGVLKQRRVAAVNFGKEGLVKVTRGDAKVLNACKSIFRSLVSTNVDDFDANPDLLNCANGVVDLRTGNLWPHSPDQRFTYCLRVPYEPEADYGLWTDFLYSVLSHPEQLMDYLQMAVGYSITGHTSEECLWYIHGPSRSGKGTFTETLLALLGGPLSTEVDFNTFTAKRDGDTQNFDLAPLRPTRFVVTSESNRYEQLNTAKIKQLTGGNYIRCAFKHRDLFTYRPQFAAWLVSNQPVNADVDDDALWYRVKVLQFPNSHIGNEDKTLKQRMLHPNNLAGVLRWIVEGSIAWYAAPFGLNHPAIIDETTKAHRGDLDMLQLWIEECCTASPGTWATHENLYRSYQDWAKLNGVEPKKARSFTTGLKAKGYLPDIKYIPATGKMTRIIAGISV